MSPGLDWELEHRRRTVSRYPYDSVVSFAFRYLKPGQKVLEVGCGRGNNLWFCAREGFRVTGVDISPTAIRAARELFDDEELSGEFAVADLTALPFDADSFDAVLDRGSVACADMVRAVEEVRRVLVPQGLFRFNPFRLAPAGVGAQDLPTPDPLLEGWQEIERELVTVEGARNYSEWRLVLEK